MRRWPSSLSWSPSTPPVHPLSPPLADRAAYGLTIGGPLSGRLAAKYPGQRVMTVALVAGALTLVGILGLIFGASQWRNATIPDSVSAADTQ